jgi:PadR family transcriptional regulator, regulatory protein PadR
MSIRLRSSRQTFLLLGALLVRPAQWTHGYALSQQTGLASGTLYPILMRLEKLQWLETQWEEPGNAGRPPRHLYRLTSEARAWAREELAEARAQKIWKPVLDYEQSRLPLDHLTQQHYLPMHRIERLQRRDPDNAVPHLLIAEVLSDPLRSQAFRALMKDGTKFEWQVEIPRDSRWLAEMERAFSAPKYDNYMLKKFQLARAVSEKYGIRDPDPTLYILMQSKLAEFEMLRAYGDYSLSVGAEDERLGDLSAATSAYWQILRFSERMSAGQPLPIEKLFAMTIGMKAGTKLQPILKTSGRADENALLGFQLAQWTAWRDQQLGKTLARSYSPHSADCGAGRANDSVFDVHDYIAKRGFFGQPGCRLVKQANTNRTARQKLYIFLPDGRLRPSVARCIIRGAIFHMPSVRPSV